MQALRARRQSAAAAAADPQVAALQAENARLRELVRLCCLLLVCWSVWARQRSAPVAQPRRGVDGQARTYRPFCPRVPARLSVGRTCLLRCRPPARPFPTRPQLADQAGEGATKTGYLCKYRGHAVSSLWAPPWELRWVVDWGTRLVTARAAALPAAPSGLHCMAPRLQAAALGVAGRVTHPHPRQPRAAPDRGRARGGLHPPLLPSRVTLLLLLLLPSRCCSYVILKGPVLSYFRSERDVQFPPRGRIDLRCRRRRCWTSLPPAVLAFAAAAAAGSAAGVLLLLTRMLRQAHAQVCCQGRRRFAADVTCS